ncbi:hypothetical protein BGX31_009540 [Mortierella sp. GBA43]|nr:hypothetical protein BGX31_009540 [Mortierella sp. GBA43]
MAILSNNAASHLESLGAKNRISFREDLNEHHCDEDGFESDFSDDDDGDGERERPPSNSADDSDGSARRALKYRKSLTMLNQLAGVAESDDENDNEPAGNEKDRILAAKKSVDDLTAWVNAAALGDSDEEDL